MMPHMVGLLWFPLFEIRPGGRLVAVPDGRRLGEADERQILGPFGLGIQAPRDPHFRPQGQIDRLPRVLGGQDLDRGTVHVDLVHGPDDADPSVAHLDERADRPDAHEPEELVQELGIEDLAALEHHHLVDLLGRVILLIGALEGQGVVDVADRDHHRGRMGPAGVRRLGIAGHVVAQMVLVGDDDGQDAQRVLVTLEDAGAEQGVMADLEELALGELRLLLDDLERDVELADVMVEGGDAEVEDVVLRELELRGEEHGEQGDVEEVDEGDQVAPLDGDEVEELLVAADEVLHDAQNVEAQVEVIDLLFLQADVEGVGDRPDGAFVTDPGLLGLRGHGLALDQGPELAGANVLDAVEVEVLLLADLLLPLDPGQEDDELAQLLEAQALLEDDPLDPVLLQEIDEQAELAAQVEEDLVLPGRLAADDAEDEVLAVLEDLLDDGVEAVEILLELGMIAGVDLPGLDGVHQVDEADLDLIPHGTCPVPIWR